MDPIRIQVDINIGERTEAFLTKLFAGVITTPKVQPEIAQPKAEAPKPVAPKPAVPTAPKASAEPATTASESSAIEKSGASVDIKDIRKLLATKVNAHREAIKAKLNEYGVANVTTLPKDKYAEFHEFLSSL